MRRIAITGYGVVTPAGVGHEVLWDAVTAGKSLVREVTRFDSNAYSANYGTEIEDFKPGELMSKRLVKKTDRFTHLALASTKLAFDHANLSMDQLDPTRVGFMVGNILGGWEFAERELRNLWTGGVRNVSPYQATAWFPAAPQGITCIQYGIKGRARTFISDRASGSVALIEAAESIRRNQADVMIAGGTEAPYSPYAWLCLQNSGFLTNGRKHAPEAAYRPFDRDRNGTAVGEGATFVVLEAWDHAVARGAKIYGEIKGWNITNDAVRNFQGVADDGVVYARAISKSIEKAGLTPADIDYVSAHGAALAVEDESELKAIRAAFGDAASNPSISVPKSTIGHLLGAAPSTDLAIALMAMEKGIVPPTANLDQVIEGHEDLNFVTKQPQEREINNTVILARGMGGINASIVVSKPSL